MRLCYIASGISIHTKRWVNYFARRGHEVHLISSRFTEGYEEFDNRVQMHPLVRLLPQIWKLSGYVSGILWLFQVRRLVERIKPDILDAHYIGVPAYLGIASGFHPLVLSAWGSDVLIDPKKSIIRKNLTKYTLRRSDRIICVSPVLKEELMQLGAVPANIDITPLGIDIQIFYPRSKNEELLRQFDIINSPVIISTRSLKPVYDVETLIKAIPLVLQDIPDAKFIICGLGEQRNYLEDLAQTSGTADSIRFVGWIPNDQLSNYLNSADVYVSTSLSDGTSISLLEALACELASVVTDIPANRPWVADGETGFLIPVGEYKTLAERIVLLLKNKDMRSRFGKAGGNFVKERANYEKEMEKVESIYLELERTKSQPHRTQS